MTRVNCPSCQTVIPAEHINIQQTLAVCPNCHQVFDFKEQVHSTAEDEKAKRRKVKQPQDILMETTPEGLDITYRWTMQSDDPRNKFYAVGAALLGLGLFLVFGAAGSFSLALLIGLPVLLFGFHYFVASSLNHTRFEVRQNGLRVSTAPVPYYGFYPKKEVALDRVARFGTRLSKWSDAKANSQWRFYDVIAVLHDGTEIDLLIHMQEAYTLFIAQELNAELYGAAADDDAGVVEAADAESTPTVAAELSPLVQAAEDLLAQTR
jgi:DNA-directed RNA polymerase subunit M/transcription elongation factor TFIIS